MVIGLSGSNSWAAIWRIDGSVSLTNCSKFPDVVMVSVTMSGVGSGIFSVTDCSDWVEIL